MPFVNFWKKFRCFSFDFRQNFDVRTFPRWLSICRTKFFLRDIKNIFFFKIFTLVLLDRFLAVFSKFWLFIGETFSLGIFESFSKIIACICWAYAETILSHAEHTQNRFHRMLSIRGTNFRACSASGKMWTFLHVQSMLSIREKNFIAHWAYWELILSHTEHTGNRFHRMLSMRGKVEYLGRIEYDFQKSRVTGPWDHKVSVSAKKVKKMSCLSTFRQGAHCDSMNEKETKNTSKKARSTLWFSEWKRNEKY